MFHQRRAVCHGRVFLALVKFKMAERFFKENSPSREINRFLRRNKGRHTSQTDNCTQLRQISSFYSQLDVAVDTLEAKYTSNMSRSKDREIQQLLPSQGMVLQIRGRQYSFLTK